MNHAASDRVAVMTRVRMIWLRLPDSVRWGTVLFVVARFLFWIWGILIVTLLPYSPPTRLADALPAGLIERLLSPWFRFDAMWFTGIAVQGYTVPDGRGAFSPLYPLLIRGGGVLLGGHYSLAAFVIANLCCWASLILLFEIAQREFQVGQRTLIALLLYPFAFFLFVPYSEALQLLLTLIVFWSIRKSRWWLAGVCGALAVLTKVTALALLPALALSWWLDRNRRPLWQGAWLLLIPLAAGGWAVVRQAMLSVQQPGLAAPIISPDFQNGWNVDVVWPWEGLAATVMAPFRLWPSSYTVMAVINLAVMALVVYLTILAARLPNRSYAVYALTMLAINLMLSVRLVPAIDVPRRMLMAFPIFIAAAMYWPHGGKRLTVLVALAFQLTLSALFIKWVLIG